MSNVPAAAKRRCCSIKNGPSCIVNMSRDIGWNKLESRKYEHGKLSVRCMSSSVAGVVRSCPIRPLVEVLRFGLACSVP